MSVSFGRCRYNNHSKAQEFSGCSFYESSKSCVANLSLRCSSSQRRNPVKTSNKTLAWESTLQPHPLPASPSITLVDVFLPLLKF